MNWPFFGAGDAKKTLPDAIESIATEQREKPVTLARRPFREIPFAAFQPSGWQSQIVPPVRDFVPQSERNVTPVNDSPIEPARLLSQGSQFWYLHLCRESI